MRIKSTIGHPRPLLLRERPEQPEKESESFKIPDVVSKPRSGLSAVNRLLRAADGFGWIENPVSKGYMSGVSAVGAGFATANVLGELVDGDFRGAFEDAASGASSLIGGASLLGASQGALQALSLAGVTANAALAVNSFEEGDRLEAAVRASTAAGLAFRAVGGETAKSIGLAILGVTGIATTLGYYLDPIFEHQKVFRRAD